MHHSLSKVLKEKGVKFDVHLENARPTIFLFPFSTSNFLEIITTIAEINKNNGKNPIWSLAPNTHQEELCLILTYSGDPPKYGTSLNYLALRLNGNTL